MAAAASTAALEVGKKEEEEEEEEEEEAKQLLSSYIGISFTLFVALLPKNSSFLEAQVKELRSRLVSAEEQLKLMKSRRREDSKANARVVDIFASHRNAWQAEEKRLLQQIDAATEEMANFRSDIEQLERDKLESHQRIRELEGMIGFISRRGTSDFYVEVQEQEEEEEEHFAGHDGQNRNFGFSSTSKFWPEPDPDRASLWQDVQYDSLESIYHKKHFVSRRESPWKVDGESTGVFSKLKLLEQELMNLEKIGKSDLSRVPSITRKQVKRYQALAGKIDDLCRRMQASDPCESTLGSDFRTQRQTEFLLEALQLQQRAAETGQKLVALQTEIGKIYYGDQLGSQSKLMMRRSFDSIRNNLKEIQRNLEIWLARIIGDLEGILVSDGTSRVRERYISSYPFDQ